MTDAEWKALLDERGFLTKEESKAWEDERKRRSESFTRWFFIIFFGVLLLSMAYTAGQASKDHSPPIDTSDREQCTGSICY